MSSSVPKCVHIAGFTQCGYFQRAMNVLRSIAVLFPNKLKVIEHTFDDRTLYRNWLLEGSDPFRNNFIESSPARTHSSSPFVWFSKSVPTSTTTIPDSDILCNPADIDTFLGGHDDTITWCRTFVSPQVDDNKPKVVHVDDGHIESHEYEYDLIVIGGGSGGMAAAKEAADLGAKVALFDYVKPSPIGTTWGLGGTCVNVGCIPKKLFHTGSLLRESIHLDSVAFGIEINKDSKPDDSDTTMKDSATTTTTTTTTNGDGDADHPMITIDEPKSIVHWSIVRENINNYIRSLNFKYRVRLREKKVSYFNKLAKFINTHTIEVTDKNGKVETMTSSRFLIATGGRPSALDCEGGHLAISSDDIFNLQTNPGKVLCIGASYISLECAGFLAGLSYDVTIAVRSILLRGFDRECCDYIGNFMESMHGITFKKGIVPVKLERQSKDQGPIMVTFSDGTTDTYDTVLTAIGRTADTDLLGVDTIQLQTNPKNKKLIGTNEQTNIPNIYAVGDVLDDTPELTPVAIQAGILLARRLFGKSTEPMDYINVCTTVFTPLEYSCVGYSEEDAYEIFGKDNIEVYHREFIPLEWSLSYSRPNHKGFAKVIVNKLENEKIIGIHYVGPNAGEVLQGYGVGIKKGITYKDLVDTVGIHPTSAEEIVTISTTKSSGEDAGAAGC